MRTRVTSYFLFVKSLFLTQCKTELQKAMKTPQRALELEAKNQEFYFCQDITSDKGK